MKHVLILIINLYQNSLGLYMRGACRFSPTCSEYMKESIKKYGVVWGLQKGLLRLLRCHPYSKHFGIDEV